MRILVNAASIGFLTVLLGACGGGGGSATPVAQSNTYSTTSSKGDYSEWTISGNHLDAIWYTVLDTGAIAYTTTISATCAAPDAYDVRSCSVDTSSCSDGVGTCPTGSASSLQIREVPGIALFAKVDSDMQLHVGFAKDSTACSQDVSGDYTMIRTGLGLNESFGMTRVDSNLLNVLHSNFGFDAPSATDTPTIAYRTGTESESLVDDGCASGVRIRQSGGDTVRAMITGTGLFVLDLPAYQGGMMGFKTGNAASLSDFANKSFGGIQFVSDGTTDYVNADFGVVSGGKIDFNVSLSSGASGTLSLLDLDTPTTVSTPPYPDFSVSPSGYSASVLATSYPAPDNIPGLFKLDGSTDGTQLVLAAMKFGGKVIAVGMGYHYRTTAEIDPVTGLPYPADGLYNSGNFLLFEK
jgi:hypothetical protein